MKYTIVSILALTGLLFAAAPAVAGEAGTHECTTTIGLSNPVIGVSLDLSDELGIALGGCSLVTLTDPHTVASVDAAEGCAVSVDVDGDGLGDAEPMAGESYDADAHFFVTCDLGVLDAVSSIILA